MPLTKDLVIVTETARDFLLKSGFLSAQLEKAEPIPESGKWRLSFNVGITRPNLKTVLVEDSTGKVIGFE